MQGRNRVEMAEKVKVLKTATIVQSVKEET